MNAQLKPMILVLLTITLSTINTFSQNVGINSTGATPNASALLDVEATDKGILIPRVSLSSTTDVTTVTTPATNLLVFNTNSSMTNGNGAGFYYYDGSSWTYMVAPSNGPGTSGEVLTSQGGGSAPEWASTGGECLPSAVSNTTWSGILWSTCVSNCGSLSESGFTDWYVPSFEEYVYARGSFPAPVGGWINALFFTSTHQTASAISAFNESIIGPGNADNVNPRRCRCIR